VKPLDFSQKDIAQIRKIGLNREQILDQIALFRKGTPYLDLVRPCLIGDGIKRLSARQRKRLIAAFEKETGRLSLTKFVPASGAATRMFNTLIRASRAKPPSREPGLDPPLLENSAENDELLTFIINMRRFAFYDDLCAAMAADDLDAKALIRLGKFRKCLSYLLTNRGLGYANLPKGLIKFHAYSNGARTAFEEHLVEAAGYAATQEGLCDLHFTVSETHLGPFKSLFASVKDRYAAKLKVCLQVSFSIQQPQTNTIAVDMDNRPFRRDNGSLLFRPGGHGALIENLNRLDADIIFIKNIDNVAHDRFKPVMFSWKKALAGYLITIQDRVFGLLEGLDQTPAAGSVINRAAKFVQNQLCRTLPREFEGAGKTQKRQCLVEALDRPLRVCGMVKNVGAPGGGPFWVRDKTGNLSIQIVETAQVDTASRRQAAVLNAATHFNPVDIVCGVRNRHGKKFDLTRYVDHAAVFIATKHESGRELKALEHPGLWNGAMAHWNTVFVEVPLITFNPVKRVVDLLQKAHRPPSS
jgi:hypothetical protein